MAVWSSLGRLMQESRLLGVPWLKMHKHSGVVKRSMSDHGPRLMPMEGSRWQWHKFKDLFHFYFMLGAGWSFVLIAYTNMFIGPAQLAPIPEDYEPKHWEYHKHPITRFIARYLHPSPQQEYEKYLHLVSEMRERQLYRKVQRNVNEHEGLYRDSKSSYFVPVTADHTRAIIDDISRDIYKHRSAVASPQH